MGTDEKKQLKLTVKAILYYILLLSISVLVLFALSRIIYLD